MDTRTAQAIDVDALRAYFERQGDVLVAMVFESARAPEDPPYVELEVAVLLDGSPGRVAAKARRDHMTAELARMLGQASVDVFLLNDRDDSPLRRFAALESSRLLVCRDERSFKSERGLARTRYYDWLAFMEKHRLPLPDGNVPTGNFELD